MSPDNSTPKRCTGCKKELPHSDFARDSSRGDGLSYRCRTCDRAHGAAYRESHRAERHARYEEHRTEKRAYNVAYYAAHKEEQRAYKVAHAAANAEKRREYLEKNRERTVITRAKYNRTHADKRRAARLAWRLADPERTAEILRGCVRRDRERHPDRLAARRAVQAAIKSGALPRQACQQCGGTKADAHHHLGYEREQWLNVTWLCRKCHGEAHRRYAV